MSGDGSGSGKGYPGWVRDEILEIEVTKIWMNLVRHVDDVFVGHRLGFEHILEWADPSLEKIVSQLTTVGIKVSMMLDMVSANETASVKDTERLSTLINCDTAIHLVRRVHVALQRNDEDEYRSCIDRLIMLFQNDSRNCPSA